MADAQIRRFVEPQRDARALGIAHGADDRLRPLDGHDAGEDLAGRALPAPAGIDRIDYTIVQNGSVARLPDEPAATRAASSCSSGCAQARSGRARAAQIAAPARSARRSTARTTRPTAARRTRSARCTRLVLDGARTGDLVVTHDAGGAFSDPVNPLAGNHGGPQTRDNFMAVIGPPSMVQQRDPAGELAGLRRHRAATRPVRERRRGADRRAPARPARAARQPGPDAGRGALRGRLPGVAAAADRRVSVSPKRVAGRARPLDVQVRARRARACRGSGNKRATANSAWASRGCACDCSSERRLAARAGPRAPTGYRSAVARAGAACARPSGVSCPEKLTPLPSAAMAATHYRPVRSAKPPADWR